MTGSVLAGTSVASLSLSSSQLSSQSFCSSLSQRPCLVFLHGYCVAGGGRGGSGVPYPLTPSSPLPLRPRPLLLLSEPQAGSRAGIASSVPLRSPSRPSLSHGYRWAHSGTCFICFLFRTRLYLCDYHRLQAGWGQERCKGRKTHEPAVLSGSSSVSSLSVLAPPALDQRTLQTRQMTSLPFLLQPHRKLADLRRKRRQEGGTVSLVFPPFQPPSNHSVTSPKCLPQGLTPVGLLVTIFSNPGGES